MYERDLRLLSLDGGGVRGLSTLQILKQLMDTVDPGTKPCDYFNMIGGTSTGGLIAIMLGRLGMTVDECIDAYVLLSDRIFQKQRHRVNLKGQVQGRFDSDELVRAIKEIVVKQGLAEDTLLKDDPKAKCKVFVCATSTATSDTVRLTSYHSPRHSQRLLRNTTIWEAGRATSAAPSFFDPTTFPGFGESFVDGATGANNPIYEVWTEAQDMWQSGPLEDRVKCLVSIGTGVPSLTPFKDDLIGIGQSLQKIATETEKTAEQFLRDKFRLDDTGRYYRFNVSRGLENIGLEDSKQMNVIIAATERYIDSQTVFKQIKACAYALSGRTCLSSKEVLDLVSKAQKQAESGRSALHRSSEKIKANEESMHTATADFLSVLWGFLHSFWFSSLVSPSLPQSLKNIIWQTLATLRAVIDDDKVIVEGLQTKMINTQQTVEEIEVAEERIRDCIEVSRRNIDVQSLYREDPRLQGAMPYSKLQEMEQRTINGDADLNHRNDDCARHAEQLLALQQERKALQKTIKQCEHKQKQLEKRIMSLEKRQQEFERQQAETEGKASLQTIWEWIKRVLRF